MSDEVYLKDQLMAELLELRQRNAELEALLKESRRIEEALRHSEERLEVALTGADLGSWDRNVRTGEVFRNHRWAEMLGYSLEEIASEFAAWERLLHPDDKTRVLNVFNAHLKGYSMLYEAEYRLRTASGEWKWILDRGKVIERDESGQPLRVAGTHLDITDRKQAEQALRESEAKFRLLSEQSLLGIVIMQDGLCKYLNQAAADLAEYSVDEIRQWDQKEFSTKVHPEDQAFVLDQARRRQSGDLQAAPFYPFRIITKTGKVKWVEVYSKTVPFEGRSADLITVIDITERKRLEERSQLLSQMVEQSCEGIALSDMDGNLVFVNNAFAEMHGYNSSELTGKHLSIFHTPDQMPQVEAALRRLKETGEFRGEVWRMRRDGTLFPTFMHNTVLRDEGGHPIGLVGAAYDTTKLKQTEAALQERTQTLQALFHASPAAIIALDSCGYVKMWNPAAERMFGWSAEEAVGHLNPMVPIDKQEEFRLLRKRVLEGKGISGFELTRQKKDGAPIEISLATAPLRDPHGNITGIIGIMLDITARKRAEQVQRRLATAIEQAAEGIAITDSEGIIQYVNPAFERITGYAQDEVIGEKRHLMENGEGDPALYRKLWATLGSGIGWAGRLANKKKDGTVYHEDVTISPVRDDQGKIINYVAVKRDVTQEVQLEKQLLHAQKMEAIGTLAGGIAHDFNNLLTVVLGYSELLLMDKNIGDRAQADLKRINQSARNGADLVQRLLTFSRKVEPQLSPINLNLQVEEVKSLLWRTIPKMIHIELSLQDGLALTNADPTQIEQVLMNLAVNARDAMPDGGTLTIRTANLALDQEFCKTHLGAKAGRYVLLSVSDTGHGMDKETLDHIFEPFYTTKEMGRGTGLGLAMAYGIVKQHSGYIECLSTVGHGTTFKIYLPALETGIELDERIDKKTLSAGTETILLVDDEEFIRDLGVRILSRAGYTVLTAANGKEALELYEKEGKNIALVILDLIMPEMGGKQCLEELLKIDPQTRILIASGYSADGSTKEAIESRAKGFVGKPYDVRQILQAVRGGLDAE